MAITNSLNPLVVKTALDSVFWQKYQFPQNPGTATRETPEIFNQVRMDNAAHIEAVGGGGGGLWTTKSEQQAPDQGSPRVANKVTYTAETFAKDLAISKEFFDDNMHSTWEKMIEDFAFNGRATQENQAFKLWRGAFTTTLTADGVSMINAAHVTIAGPTVRNRLTLNPSISDTAMNTAFTLMAEMKSQDGVIMGKVPATLLVPTRLWKTACQIIESQLVNDTANNAMNIYSSKYNIKVFQSPYLGAAAGGSDTAWFLLANSHSVTRYIREDLITELLDWRYTTNQDYLYRGRYREEYGCSDYSGLVGSDGTNA